jgi:hypothetical protein
VETLAASFDRVIDDNVRAGNAGYSDDCEQLDLLRQDAHFAGALLSVGLPRSPCSPRVAALWIATRFYSRHSNLRRDYRIYSELGQRERGCGMLLLKLVSIRRQVQDEHDVV